jgi:hypothetical protein
MGALSRVFRTAFEITHRFRKASRCASCLYVRDAAAYDGTVYICTEMLRRSVADNDAGVQPEDRCSLYRRRSGSMVRFIKHEGG